MGYAARRTALDQVKEGDKIKFCADRVDGTLMVTEMQVSK